MTTKKVKVVNLPLRVNENNSILPIDVRDDLINKLIESTVRVYEELDKLEGKEYIEAYLQLSRIAGLNESEDGE